MTHQASNNVVQFDEEQAALLEQLAAQLAQDEGLGGDLNAYGYADVNSQSNGFFPDDENLNFTDTYPFAGLFNGFQDSENPTISAGLLEDLANTEHTPEVENSISTSSGLVSDLLDATPATDKQNIPSTDDVLAGLLEAVAAAGKESAIREQLLSLPDDGFFRRSFIPVDRSKRQRAADHAVPSIERSEFSDSKRRRTTPPRKGSEELAGQREIWGTEYDGNRPQDEALVSEPDTVNRLEAKATGGPSKSTLYRAPTKAPRKYSRPAMSKLFSSLELQPEPFLYLQAAAKAYMLDPDHPDRKDCVGVKGRGESDTTKLKLYATVKAFLKNEGWGKKCFGSAAPDVETRNLKWPEHEHKLIALVTPLMRRMVTNERQRQYALDKRQGIMGFKERASSATPTESLPAPTPRSSEEDSPMSCNTNLDQCSLSVFRSRSTDDGHSNPTTQQNGYNAGHQKDSDDPEVRYHVNIMKDGRRMHPRVVLTPIACPGFSNLTEHIGSLIEVLGQKLKRIQVLGPGSLLEAKDEDTWKEAIEMIKKSEWMDGDVKCVVEVEEIE